MFLFTFLCISVLCPRYESLRGWLSCICICMLFVISITFSYTAESSIVLHWTVMHVEHGALIFSFFTVWMLYWCSSLKSAVIQGIFVHSVFQTRKQPQEWAIIGWNHEILSLGILIMEELRWLGDNFMRWIVRWNCPCRNGSGDTEGETRRVSNWITPSSGLFLFLIPCLITGPIHPYSHGCLTDRSPYTRLWASYW